MLLLLQELFWLIVLLTPAVTAGSLGHEKERGTLLALFGTQLRSWEIVIGKLLGRLVPLMFPVLATLPFLVMGTISGGLSPVGVFLAVALLVEVMVVVAGASMLTSVWTRRTSDAILACYASLIVVLIGTLVVLPDTPLPAWLDPGSVLEQIVTCSEHWLPQFLIQGLTLGSVGAICLALAIWRLRPACLRQQEQRSKRWLCAYRRPMGNDPVAWRERHVVGLAPLPWLRMVPTWMGLLGVFSFPAIVAVDPANFATGNILYSLLQAGNLVGAYRSIQITNPDRVQSHLVIMGIVLIVGGTILVGIRCGNSISEEKRRKTWEDLVLTPLTIAEIMGGKRRGILVAACSPLIAYALPMFGLAALRGTTGFVSAAVWATLAFVATPEPTKTPTCQAWANPSVTGRFEPLA